MPADYINKLARMFQDIKVSEDLNQEFKKNYRTKGDIAGNYIVKIITMDWSLISERGMAGAFLISLAQILVTPPPPKMPFGFLSPICCGV